MKVWENFKTLSDAMPNLMQKTCWMKCANCRAKWNDTKTVFVHMIIQVVNKISVTKFICDDCLDEAKEQKAFDDWFDVFKAECKRLNPNIEKVNKICFKDEWREGLEPKECATKAVLKG